MGQNLYFSVVHEIYSATLKKLQEDSDLKWIGFQCDSLRNVIDDGLKSKKFNHDEAHQLLDLLGEYVVLEDMELERLRVTTESLANQ